MGVCRFDIIYQVSPPRYFTMKVNQISTANRPNSFDNKRTAETWILNRPRYECN